MAFTGGATRPNQIRAIVMLFAMTVMTIMVVTVCHDATVGSVHEEVKGDLDATSILIKGYNAMKSREAQRKQATEATEAAKAAAAAKAAKKITTPPKRDEEQDALDALPPAMAAMIKRRQDARRKAKVTAEMSASLDIPKETMLLQVPTAPAAQQKAECKDSAEWHVKGSVKQDCEWVGWEEYPAERRCDQKDEQGVAAHQACKLVCGSCGVEPPSVDDHGSILSAAADTEEELLQVTNFDGEETNDEYEDLPDSMALKIQHENARNAMRLALSGKSPEDKEDKEDKAQKKADQVYSGEMPDAIRHKIAVRNARTAMAEALNSGFEDDLN
jgi:hypothetical protein